MNEKHAIGWCLWLGLSAVSPMTWAVDPNPIKLSDAVLFSPTLKVSERYDDNFRATDESVKSSWITRIEPTFNLGAEGRKTAYNLSYRAASDFFHSSPDDNNTDHYLAARGAVEFDARKRLRLNAGYEHVEQTDSDNPLGLNDIYTKKVIGGVFTYGARTASTQLETGLDYQQLRYLNGAGINDDKERNTTTLRTTGYYRIAPRTRALLEYRHLHYDYIYNDPRSNDTDALLVGLTWDASARLSGTVKVGREKKRFEQAGLQDKSSQRVEASLKYKPRTYSTISFGARQALDEGDEGPASTIESKGYDLGWEHRWRERLTTDLRYSHSERVYQDYYRDDTLNSLSLGVTWSARRWLDVGASYRRAVNDSTTQSESYKRNILQFSVESSF